MDSYWSPRTFSRFWQALRMMDAAGVPDEEQKQAIKTATRANGSVNLQALRHRGNDGGRATVLNRAQAARRSPAHAPASTGR